VDRDTIVILDFGSQYSQLITRRVRECHVYCELLPHDAPREQVEALAPVGFILSGGPASVYKRDAPHLPDYVLASGRPVLGICYGMQLLAYDLAGVVAPADRHEYGLAQLQVDAPSSLFRGLPSILTVWMSHGDRIVAMPPGFSALAHTDNSPVAAMGDAERHLYGLQFHPEVAHTPQGKDILRNFLYDDCGCHGTWTPGVFVEGAIKAIRQQVGDGRVICALSGGVDSTVTGALVHRAIGDQLTCVFVDHGLLRLGEAQRVLALFRQHLGLRVHFVEAQDRFLECLRGSDRPRRRSGVSSARPSCVCSKRRHRSWAERTFWLRGRSIPM